MNTTLLRNTVKRIPRARSALRALRDRLEHFCFVAAGPGKLSVSDRARISKEFRRIGRHVASAHTEGELLSVAGRMLALPSDVKGAIVEAGCYQGASTAKLSILAEFLGRKLLVFDSFCGIPPNEEDDGRRSAFGESTRFPAGAFAGSLQLVKQNVTDYGRIDRCQFIEGWFDDTMPQLHTPIACGYLDVDLPSSTATCLRNLYPLLSPGGLLISQDAHLPAVVDVIEDARTWESISVAKPRIERTRHKRLLIIHKQT
jgi:O-methyltransferase